MSSYMLYPRNTSTRRVLSLDGMWRFSFDPEGIGTEKGWQNGLPATLTMPVPSSFQDYFTDKDSREFSGDVWYETDVFVPSEWQGQSINVRFGSATHRATVFCNGQEITSHEGGFTPFCAEISDVAVYGQYNLISVCVNNELHEYTLPAGNTILANGKKRVRPYFDFFNYSGLQRSVMLTATPKLAIQDFEVVHKSVDQVVCTDYKVKVDGVGFTACDIQVLIFDEAGVLVAQAEGQTGNICIPDVKLWEVHDAYLYKFVVRLSVDDEIIDEWFDYIGIRTISIDGTDILLNGKPVYLKGFGKHEDSDIAGRGFSLPVLKRDFELMKWIGANSFRTSHYPYSEETYYLADREGFLIIDEVAAVGFMASFANFLGQMGKRDCFFEKKTTPRLLDNHLQAVRELILRDKNHACVIAWSLFNEPESNHESAYPYFEKIFKEALLCDPQKRPRTFAMERSSDFASCHCRQLCDLITLNRYYGWYISGGPNIDDAERAFVEEMEGWKNSGIDVPVVFTEYGTDTDSHMHKLPSVMWSQEYQQEMLAMNHRVFDSYDFVKGEQIWNFADFQTTEGIMRVDGNKKGIFTRQRQPKSAAFDLKQRWESLPRDYKSTGGSK